MPPSNLQGIQEEEKRKLNIQVGCSGSVATIKDSFLYTGLKDTGLFNIEFIYTKNARHFSNLLNLDNKDMPEPPKCYFDEDEWKWQKIGDPVLHIELRKWADMLLIAPLSCNTMAKISNGMSDNLLTSVVRAWDLNEPEEISDMILGSDKLLKKPIIVAPAMNTMMYDNPFTYMHYQMMKSQGFVIIDAISKELACGDIGKGAMENVNNIVKKCKYIAEEYLLNQNTVIPSPDDSLHEQEIDGEEANLNKGTQMNGKVQKVSIGVGDEDEDHCV